MSSNVIAVSALLIAAAAAFFTWSQSRGTHRQARAAEDQVAALHRQIELMEEQITAARVPYRPPWALRHVRNDLYELVNEGADPERDVTITPPGVPVSGTQLEHDTIEPGCSAPFIVALTMGSSRTFTVTWRHRPGEDLRTWSRTLPAKPPR